MARNKKAVQASKAARTGRSVQAREWSQDNRSVGKAASDNDASEKVVKSKIAKSKVTKSNTAKRKASKAAKDNSIKGKATNAKATNAKATSEATKGRDYASHLFDPRSAATVPYPSQSKNAPSNVYAGELRGYYGPPQFNSYPSNFGDVRKENGQVKAHKGVDIYSPYLPYPHETPIYAICGGRVVFKYDDETPDGLGNRVWLYPDPKKLDRVIYGHLNRFSGHDRKVAKGDLLGFSGCSGNANTIGECTTSGALNINSGHVHVAYLVGGDTPADPTDEFDWTLRFSDLTAPVSLKTWTDEGHLLKKPDPPIFTAGTLRMGRSAVEAVAKSAGPKAFDAPFGTIDLDNAKAIEALADFYKLALVRLETDEIKHPKAKFHQFGVNKFRGSNANVAERLARLREIEIELSAIKPKPDKPDEWPAQIQQAQTFAAEYLFECIRMLWLAYAGDALLAVARSPGQLHHDKQGEVDLVPGGWPGKVPQSGIGLAGSSVLVCLGNGRAAIHDCVLKDVAADDGTGGLVLYSGGTLSVSLGAGTPWHAVFDQKIEGEIEALEKKERAKPLAAYVAAARYLHFRVRAVASLIVRNASVIDDVGLKRFLNYVQEEMWLISKPADDESGAGAAVVLLEQREKISTAAGTILALLTAIAKTSGDAATHAGKYFDPKVPQLKRIRNSYGTIWIEPAS